MLYCLIRQFSPHIFDVQLTLRVSTGIFDRSAHVLLVYVLLRVSSDLQEMYSTYSSRNLLPSINPMINVTFSLPIGGGGYIFDILRIYSSESRTTLCETLVRWRIWETKLEKPSETRTLRASNGCETASSAAAVIEVGDRV